ncbi:MAG: hypothetical protein JXO22_17020, partial [Phycisphaerae bacterium]|nr:hypothetical protein [Phycisphaerae bacterium]
MGFLASAVRSSHVALVAVVMAAITLPAVAQTTNDDLLTGQATQAWEAWQAAMDAVRDQDSAAAEQAFARLL